MRPIDVVVQPGPPSADDAPRTNTYVSAVFGRLGAHGVRVHPWPGPRGRVDVVHLEWPEQVLGTAVPQGRHGRLSRGLARIALRRARGARIVWTVHNLVPHAVVLGEPDTVSPEAWDRRFDRVARLVDVVVHLTEASIGLVIERYPRLASRRHVVIPRPHLREELGPLPPPVPRAALRRLLIAGTVSARKRVPEAILAVRALGGAEPVSVTVLGACEDRDLAAGLGALAAPDLALRLEPFAYPDLARERDRHDAILVPQGEFHNTGLVHLALSLGLPVIVTATPVTRELAARFGPDLVRLAEGGIRPEALAPLLGPFAGTVPDLTAHGPDAVAAAHAALYRDLVGRSRPADPADAHGRP